MGEDYVVNVLQSVTSKLGFSSDNQARAGKIVISTTLCAAIFSALAFLVLFDTNVPQARADDVSTSVTVLNTAPSWTVDAEETTESSTSTPTNSSSVITWHATGTDSALDNYYLIICKTNGTPTANANNPPSCNGGVGNQWAVSGSVVSGVRATAATTTKETFPFENEKNDWWAWICDANSGLPKCNSEYRQGNGHEGRSSPFAVNHPPVFSSLSNSGNISPDGTITWTTVSYDNDTLQTNDQVRVLVCRAAGITNGACTGTTWATSTLTAANAATSTTLFAPYPDGFYDAFVYVVDTHNHSATSSLQASSSSFRVNNVTPTVTAATISLEDTDSAVDPLTLLTPNSTSGPFKVKFTASDNNSCVNLSSGSEITTVIANIYRSGVTQAGCDASGEYNSNNCYVNASPLFSPEISCTQDGGTCSGSSDDSSTWTCNFSLWFNADPTTGAGASDTEYFGENWRASVQISDDNFATSTLEEGTTPKELNTFLAFDVSSTSIPYGSLEPNSNVVSLATSTDLRAVGNIGLDQDLFGDTMCTTWTTSDSCDNNGYQTGSDILVANQKFATSNVLYGSGLAYPLTASSTPSELLINIPKTIATSSVQVKYTHWGIAIPAAITTSGSYTGQNTITAKKSDANFW